MMQRAAKSSEDRFQPKIYSESIVHWALLSRSLVNEARLLKSTTHHLYIHPVKMLRHSLQEYGRLYRVPTIRRVLQSFDACLCIMLT